MKKSTKKAPKPPVVEPISTEDDASDGSKNVDERIATLGNLIRRAEKHFAQLGEYNRDTASHIAWMANKQVSLIGEQRKYRAAERSKILKITPALIISWVRLQTKEYREQLARDVIAMDAEGVLA